MFASRRLWTVAAFLAAVAVVSSAHLRGDNAHNNQPGKLLPPDSKKSAPQQPAGDADDGLAQSKFEQGGIMSYQTTKGERLFAWQRQVSGVFARRAIIVIMKVVVLAPSHQGCLEPRNAAQTPIRCGQPFD